MKSKNSVLKKHKNIINKNNIFPYKLSFCMIVKNEEKNIERCLKSIMPLVYKNIAEIIVVDTGSEDRTVELVKRYTNDIYNHEWKGSFSEARNYSFSLAKGEYIFMIDADEEINKEHITEIIKVFNEGKNDICNTYTIKLKNYTDDNLDNYYYSAQKRIFENNKEFYFRGNVHEQPVCSEYVQNLNVELLHYGYIDDEELQEGKFKRNSELLITELEKCKDINMIIYYRFQLAASYYSHGDYYKALEQLHIYLSLIKQNWSEIKNTFTLAYYNLAVDIYLNNNLYDRALEICNEALAIQPDYIDFIYYKAIIMYTEKKYNETIQYMCEYLRLLEEIHEHEIINKPDCAFYTLNYSQEAIERIVISSYLIKEYELCVQYGLEINNKDTFKNLLYLLVSSHIKLGKYEELLQFHITKIAANKEREMRELFNYFLNQSLACCCESEKNQCVKNFEENNINNNNTFNKNDNKLLEIINYFDVENTNMPCAEMIYQNVLPIIEKFEINDYDHLELNGLKKSALFILNRTLVLKQFNTVTKAELLDIFYKYIYIIKILIEKHKTEILEERDILFYNNMSKALEKIENNQLLDGVRFLKEGVIANNQMARPIEIYLETIIPGYIAKIDYECSIK